MESRGDHRPWLYVWRDRVLQRLQEGRDQTDHRDGGVHARPAIATTIAAVNAGETAYHLLLLAENLEGYKNLIKLSSLAYREGFLLQAAHR